MKLQSKNKQNDAGKNAGAGVCLAGCSTSGTSRIRAMKTRFSIIGLWAAGMIGMALLPACFNNMAEASTNAIKTAGATNQPAVQPAATNAAVPAPPPKDLTNAPVVEKKAMDPALLNLTPGLADVIKMAQSGVAEEIIVEFVKKSQYDYQLTADEVIYLNDLGISTNIVSAMLTKPVNRDTAAAPAQPEPAPAPQAAPPPTNPPPAEAAPQPAPQPQVEAQPQPAQVQTQVVVQTQPVTVVAAPTPVYTYYYDSLLPYGTWIYLDGYGYCWQPTVVVTVAGWRPYLHGGHWIYTDCGWYWHSYYTWGWAPFHYGRWFRHHHHGWVWAPDTVWGPAWVSWRYSSGYCGWAPLPPAARYGLGVGFSYYGRSVGISFEFGLSWGDYCFVHPTHFHRPGIHQHAIWGERAQPIYNQTTVINNYVSGNNNVVNVGVGRDFIARSSGTSIPTYTVRDAPLDAPRSIVSNPVHGEGGPVIYRQTLQPAKVPHERAAASPLAPANAAGARAEFVAPPPAIRAATANRASPPTSSSLAPATPNERSIPARFSTTPAAAPRSSATVERPATAPTLTPASPRPAERTPVSPAPSVRSTPATPPTPSIAPSTPSRPVERSTTPQTAPATRPSTIAPSSPSRTPVTVVPAPSTRTETPRYTPTPQTRDTTPSYVPPARSTTPSTPAPSTPAPPTPAPSRITPSSPAPSTQPSTPSTRPSRPANSSTDTTPAPRSSSLAPSSPSRPQFSVTPSTRPDTYRYTPPAESHRNASTYTPPANTYSVKPSTPSYAFTPPVTVPSARPSTPSYTSPVTVPSARPSTPSYTPPASSPQPRYSSPAPSYTPTAPRISPSSPSSGSSFSAPSISRSTPSIAPSTPSTGGTSGGSSKHSR